MKRFQFSEQFVILTIAYVNNSKTGTYLADIQNKPIQCLTRSIYQIEKEDFKQLGTVAEPLWNQFKDACVRDLCSQMEERDQETEKQKIEQQELEQKIAANLNIDPSTQARKSPKPCSHPESKRIDQRFIDQLISLLDDPQTSSLCKNSILDLIDDCQNLNDPHWVQRCNSYYLPEILPLFSQNNKTSNQKFKQECMFLIDDFEKNLRKIVERNKIVEECLDQTVQLSVFKQMMAMDGLTPDEIQKKMKR